MKTYVLVQIQIILIFNTRKGLTPNESGLFIDVGGELFNENFRKQNLLVSISRGEWTF